jgi:tetratricopeptide (TPR) repeat protein
VVESLDILFKCNDILSCGEYGFFPDLVCILWNNFGCAYRRAGKYNNALGYFEKAIIFMKKYNVCKEGKGMTYLNLSALLSQMGK